VRSAECKKKGRPIRPTLSPSDPDAESGLRSARERGKPGIRKGATQATCRQCGADFSFPPPKTGRPRTVCDRCRKENQRKAEQRLNRASPFGKGLGATLDNIRRAGQIGGANRDRVARILGISERGVRQIEAQAMAKIRSNGELMELWRECREQGIPLVDQTNAEDLLDYQIEVIRLYEVHERTIICGLKAEEIECQKEIERCQEAIARALGRADCGLRIADCGMGERGGEHRTSNIEH
jgi:hypothetical protein